MDHSQTSQICTTDTIDSSGNEEDYSSEDNSSSESDISTPAGQEGPGETPLFCLGTNAKRASNMRYIKRMPYLSL